MRVIRSFERAAKTILIVEIRSLQGRLFEEGRDNCYGRSMTKRPGIRALFLISAMRAVHTPASTLYSALLGHIDAPECR
jgi:hypothetical protein